MAKPLQVNKIRNTDTDVLVTKKKTFQKVARAYLLGHYKSINSFTIGKKLIGFIVGNS